MTNTKKKKLTSTLIILYSFYSAPTLAHTLEQGTAVPEFDRAEKDFTTKRIKAYIDKIIEEKGVKLEPLSSLPNIGTVSPQLINGIVIDPKYFPAIFRMTTGGTCTATMIGPATMYLAAHCLGDKYKPIEFVSDGKHVKGICETAPGWSKDGDQDDWALCLMSQTIPLPAYESIDLNSPVSVGETVMLSGFGCTESGGIIDGQLRIGYSQSISVPPELSPEPSTIFTRSEVISSSTIPSGAILCPGDSGGPAFRMSGDLTDKRWVIGVNSRTTYGFGVSLIAATASARGKAFVKDWATRHNQSICGLNKTQNCQ